MRAHSSSLPRCAPPRRPPFFALHHLPLPLPLPRPARPADHLTGVCLTALSEAPCFVAFLRPLAPRQLHYRWASPVPHRRFQPFTPARLVQTTAAPSPSTRGSTTTTTIIGGSSNHECDSNHEHNREHNHEQTLPPHRRRRQARLKAKASSSLPALDLPTNASTTLANLSARSSSPITRHLSSFLSLTKPRLTILVVLSAMAPYALYPTPSFIVSADAAPSLSPQTLLFLAIGTALCSSSANALNMLHEPATDALMSRTRSRPLVRRLISRRAAYTFALAAGVVGAAALYYGVNPTVAFLGTFNIALYAEAYTRLKPLTPWNTWVGAVVGGVPPLMGWAAAAGQTATRDGSWRELLFAADGGSAGGWLLASLLFAWEFPHFMALSWSIRDEYRSAGLRMLAWMDPARNARVALRYSLAFVPICVGLCAAGVTEWTFAATSLPVNVWLGWKAVGFWRMQGAGGSARGLFWASVWHLPAVMVLALLQKKSMWQRVWIAAFGDADDEEWEDV